MAMQTGVGLSKIIVLVGAGYTGTVLLKNGKLSDVLGELQALVKGFEPSGNQSDPNSEYSDAIAAQVRRLAMEVRQLASSRQITVLNGNSTQLGNVTSMIVPAAAVGALGYGYMWWKGLSFSDLMYVTKKSMATAVSNLTQHLEHVSEALNAAKRHLTQRIENLDGKIDDQRELSKEIKNEVSSVKSNLDGLGYELDELQKMVSKMDWRMVSLASQQQWTLDGVKYLCQVAEGHRVEMPKVLQEQIKISGSSRGLLTSPETPSLKGIADALALTSGRSASDVQDGVDGLDEKPKTLSRAASARC
ncbi:hypothetical protein MLD38_009693 [Melastoma candidum]|uniref:Uncharacterized protein n=1 Tax=Melastoma candidum TaxID=119954 RepID=A0ACB9RYJ3_9MYRT|nr:hypothetical protein MLD38_009693 [Melastoma candidum]